MVIFFCLLKTKKKNFFFLNIYFIPVDHFEMLHTGWAFKLSKVLLYTDWV